MQRSRSRSLLARPRARGEVTHHLGVGLDRRQGVEVVRGRGGGGPADRSPARASRLLDLHRRSPPEVRHDAGPTGRSTGSRGPAFPIMAGRRPDPTPRRPSSAPSRPGGDHQGDRPPGPRPVDRRPRRGRPPGPGRSSRAAARPAGPTSRPPRPGRAEVAAVEPGGHQARGRPRISSRADSTGGRAAAGRTAGSAGTASRARAASRSAGQPGGRPRPRPRRTCQSQAPRNRMRCSGMARQVLRSGTGRRARVGRPDLVWPAPSERL